MVTREIEGTILPEGDEPVRDSGSGTIGVTRP